ncbi:MAG: phosphatidate cytidylyltransferase [Acholeplasmatales bacterium]|nr:phosphatidate cytidylyltransferase [Acholeplasmatales bacterium]
MKKRVITGIIMLLILAPCVLVPACLPVLEFVIILLAVAAEMELLNMYDRDKKIPLAMKIVTVVLTLILAFAVLSYMSTQNGAPGSVVTDITESFSNSIIIRGLRRFHFDKVFTPVTALLINFIILMSSMIFIKDFDVKDAGRLYLSTIYVGLCMGAFLTLRLYGTRFVLYLLIVTCLTDIFALVFGLAFGRSGKHKLAPHISPKKSWEGAIGGTLVAVICGFCFCYFYDDICSIFPTLAGEEKSFFEGVFAYDTFTPAGKFFVCLILTFLLSICSQIGDLVASKLKRAYGIKDYSNVFPGHGGVLDRFDSVLFASAIFLLFIIIEMNFIDVLAALAG